MHIFVDTHICICIYVFVHMCMCICVCVYVYISIYVHMYTNVYTYICIVSRGINVFFFYTHRIQQILGPSVYCKTDRQREQISKWTLK